MSEDSFYKKKLTEILSLLPRETNLLIVSKTRSVEEIKSYYDLGHRDFGENRVQELLEKSRALQDDCPEIRWHMIGHLQSNKINQLLSVPNLVSIHSVHDLELLKKILSKDGTQRGKIGLFLQVNTSHEDEKSGFESYVELESTLSYFTKLDHFYLQGLMTMGKIRTDNIKKDAKICFESLISIQNKLEDQLRSKLETSMGMSQDYEIAIELKSNWIRLGTMMFES